jgi:hypothetical protein
LKVKNKTAMTITVKEITAHKVDVKWIRFEVVTDQGVFQLITDQFRLGGLSKEQIAHRAVNGWGNPEDPFTFTFAFE